MATSTVTVSLKEHTFNDFSYAIVNKGLISAVLILGDKVCGIFNLLELRNVEPFRFHYLLLKHYDTDEDAQTDFVHILGELCKMNDASRYYLLPLEEDNRIIYKGYNDEHKITTEERSKYKRQYNDYMRLVDIARKRI